MTEIEHLRNIRLKAWKEDDFLDDQYTNNHTSFKYETDIFINWIRKMEAAKKIDALLSSM